MDIIFIISLVSSLAGIGSLFMPDNWKSKKITIFICLLITSLLSGIIGYQYNQLARIRKISKAADILIESKQSNFTHSGFVQAALAFMEQNRDLYPDSYERARIIATTKNPDHIYGEDIEDASDLEGLLRGISTLNE